MVGPTPSLQDALRHIVEVFGSPAELVVEAQDDPDGGRTDLVLTIRSGCADAESSLALLRSLDERWWRGASGAASGVIVDVD